MVEWIVLEEVWKEVPDADGKMVLTYLGRVEIRRDEIEAKLNEIKADATDRMGFKKYAQVLKDKGIDIELPT